MILVPTSRPLYAAVDPVDFRRSFDVLIAIAREQLGLDALRSAVVLFFNKDRTRCKLLFHDGSGVVILYKRLDRAHFHVPSIVRAGDRSVRIEARELGVLLAGIERR
jgi:transposase